MLRSAASRPEEARSYIKPYFPIRAAEEQDGPTTDPKWVEQRVAELVSGRFDQLLERPVHAQMLCEIATHSHQLRTDMSVYELLDSFVHYLLLRELEKRGRDKDFPIKVRLSSPPRLASTSDCSTGTALKSCAEVVEREFFGLDRMHPTNAVTRRS